MSDKPEALRLAAALEQGTFLLSAERDATAAELRRLFAVEAQRNKLLEALNALLRDPSGCRFCDNGRPRKSVLTGELCEHDDQCGFVLARAAIAKATGEAT